MPKKPPVPPEDTSSPSKSRDEAQRKSQAPKKPTWEQATAIVEAFNALEHAVETLRDLGFGSRELSLTITNAEQASMWLQYACNELDIDLDEDDEDEDDDEEDGDEESAEGDSE